MNLRQYKPTKYKQLSSRNDELKQNEYANNGRVSVDLNSCQKNLLTAN